jgi:GGDEF domain-containing protein
MTERLHYQATHDELTGLCNRREFERLLREALAGHDGTVAAVPFALLYFDLDQFKLINDLSGHAAGDQLLVQLVRAMRAELAPGSILARLGGDEFGVLAPGVDQAQAEALAPTTFVDPFYRGGNDGRSYGRSFAAAGEHQLMPNVFVGGRIDIERSTNYTPSRFLLYVRFTLDGTAAAPVSLPPESRIPGYR